VRQLIAGNWKMHLGLDQAVALAQAVRDGAADTGGAGLSCELLLCPPATALARVAQALEGALPLGGQNCHAERDGPFTGDISAEQLRDAGASWVILGHSERRLLHGETDDQVRGKVLAASRAGLTPIVCVGETEEQRVGGGETEAVGWQIAGSLPKDFAGVLAYEPVWAIGTGKTCEPDAMAAMHEFIREELMRELGDGAAGIRILYGGSVTPQNAAELLRVPHVAGALVGGASLEAESFLAIARVAAAA
jgi:triosephosphate isomerase